MSAKMKPNRETLCHTCAHVNRCAFLGNRDEGALRCEEFTATDGANSEGKRPNPPAQAEGLAVSAEDSKLMGLCGNCLVRATCRLPKPVGGIWHCEEYE